MTCEDCEDELNASGAFERAAHKIAGLFASRPTRALARLLPQGVRKALVTVLEAPGRRTAWSHPTEHRRP
jgi:hypothetical protein